MTITEAYQLKKSILPFIGNDHLLPQATISSVIIEPDKHRELFRLLCESGFNDEPLLASSFFETEEFDVAVSTQSPSGIRTWHSIRELNVLQNFMRRND